MRRQCQAMAHNVHGAVTVPISRMFAATHTRRLQPPQFEALWGQRSVFQTANSYAVLLSGTAAKLGARIALTFWLISELRDSRDCFSAADRCLQSWSPPRFEGNSPRRCRRLTKCSEMTPSRAWRPTRHDGDLRTYRCKVEASSRDNCCRQTSVW